MTIATWIIAVSSLITAVGSMGFQVHHGRRDNARFGEHAQRLEQLEGSRDQQG